MFHLFMQEEMTRLRSGYQLSMSAKENHEAETQRLKHLYENELQLREQLISRLERANKKAVENAVRWVKFRFPANEHYLTHCS